MATNEEMLRMMLGKTNSFDDDRKLPPKPVTVMGVDVAPSRVAIERSKSRRGEIKMNDAESRRHTNEFIRASEEGSRAFDARDKKGQSAWREYLLQLGLE